MHDKHSLEAWIPDYADLYDELTERQRRNLNMISLARFTWFRGEWS
jgi:hypothetical protein